MPCSPWRRATGPALITSPGGTLGGIIRSVDSFDGEVRGTIVTQPPGGAASVRVTIGFAVQDDVALSPANHFPTDGYYLMISPEFNTVSLYRRIGEVR